MAVGSKNENYRVGPGSQGSSWRSSGNGVNAGKWSYDGYSGVNKGFSDLYSRVGSWNEKNNQEFWSSKEDDQEPERRQMSGLETFMAGLSKGAEDIAGMAGFEKAKESGDPVRTVGSFLASIPTGIASSAVSWAPKAYEAFSGTDIQSASQEDNTISTQKLSPSQRAASGVSGAIDVVGLGTGGSGRLIGGAIKGGAKALGKEAPDLFTGWATKAGGGKVAQFASDTFMEGLEEGVQTAVDDVRNEQFGADTFSRSLEAFGYGALAGGVMHGAGIGVEAAGNKVNSMRGGSSNTVEQKTSKPNIDADLSAADPWAEQQEMLKASMGASTVTPSGREAQKEILRRESETPGTASAVSTVSSEGVRMNQHKMGADTIMSVFYNNDGNKSANEVVNAFKRSGATDIDGTELTVQKMDAAFRSADPMAYINGIIQTTPRKSVRMVLGRNPDSKIGTWTSDLVEVVPGSAMQMNRSVYQMSGGDVDGDKTQAYFGESSLAQSLGYATSQLNNPSTGVTNVDFDFFAVDDVSKASGMNAENIRKKYEDSFYSTVASYSGSRNDKNAKKLLDSFFEATSSDNGKSRGDMIAQSLSDMRAFAMSKLDEAGDPDSGYNADAMLQDFIFGVNRASQFSAVIENEVQSAIREAEASLDSIELPSDGMEFVGSEGSVGNAKRVSQLLPYMGYSTSTSSKEGNPPFRQYQEIIWSAKKHEQLFDEGIDGTVTRSAFDKVLALSLRLRAIGEVPETTVESTFKNFVAHETLQNTVMKNGKMSTTDDVASMLSSFRDSYNKYAMIFDEAVKEDSLRGRFVPLSAKSKNLLEHGEGQDTVRAFVDVFSNFQSKDLFYLDESCSDKDRTIEQIIEETANSVYATGEVFVQNPAANLFFRRALADYGGRERALEKSLRETIEGKRVSELVAEATSRMSVDGRFDRRDASSMLMLLDFYNNVIGPESSLRQGLVSIDTIMATDLGRSFFSTVPSQRTNAVLSASLRATFYDCRTSLAEYERTGDAEYLEHARLEASLLSQISPLHAAVSKEILDLGTTKFLDSMVDVNRTIEEKEKAYGTLFRGSMRKPNLLVDSLKTKDSKLEVSAVSTRTRKANTSLRSAEKLSFDKSKKMLDSVDLLIKNNQVSQRDAVAAMKELAMRTVDVDQEAYLSLLNDQADISSKEGDKGQAPDSATVNYQITSKTVQGMSTSMIQEMFGLPFNTISRNEFNENRSINLMLFFDKDFEIDVMDVKPDESGKMVVTMDHYDQRRVFKEILGDQGEYDGPEPNPVQYMNALRKIPQIASRICPSGVNVTTSEGSPSVTEAYETELSNAVLGIVRNPDSAKRSEIKRRARSMLHNRPEFAAAVCGAAEGLSTTSPMNSAYTAEKLEKAYRDIVDYVTELALSGDGTTKITSIAELRSSAFSNLFDSLGMSATISSGMNDIMKTAEAATRSQVSNVVQFIADAKYKTNAVLAMKRHGADTMAVDAITGEEIVSAYGSILEKDIENVVQTYEAFASVLIAYSEDLGIFSPGSQLGDMRPSAEAVDNVEKMINGMQGSVSNQDFEAIKRTVSRIKEEGVVSEVITGDMRVLTMDDINEIDGETPRQAADRVKAKIKDIVARFGGEDDWNGGVEKMVDDAFPEYGPDGKWIVDTDEVPGDVVGRNRREVFRYANNIMMRRVTDNVLEGTSRMFDRNALYLTDTTVSFLSDAANDLRKEITSPKSEGGMGLYEEGLGSLSSKSKYSLIPPALHFDNVVNANMATRAKAAVNASSVAFKVGFEGSMGNAMHAISLLSGHADPAFCGVKPTKVAVNEVLDNPGEYEGVSFQMRDERGAISRKGFLGDSMYERLRTMAESSEEPMMIEVYKTEDCLDGACKVCGGKPMSNANEDFLHIDFIVGAIFNHMTEKRNLKKKKSTTVLREIVSKIKADFSLKSDVIEGDKLDFSYLAQKKGDALEAASSDMAKMTQLLKGYRSKVSDHYKKFFDDEGIDGLSKKHADIMASFTTPCFSITFDDGTRATFSSHSLKDVKSFMDECSKVIMSIGEDGVPSVKNVSEVKVVVVSPIDISNKIGANVAFKAIESDMSGKTFNGTDVTEWARSAFHDWSDVSVDSVGSLELYRGVAPSNRSVPTKIRSASSRTVSQYFFQEVESMFTKNWDSPTGGDPSDKCIKSAERVKSFFNGMNGDYGKDSPFTIIRSFVDIGERAYLKYSSEVLSELKTLESNTDDGAFGNEWVVIGDSSDESTNLKAFNHAKQTGRKVLLPKDSSVVRAKSDCVVVPNFRLAQGFEYAMIDPSIEKTIAMSVDGMPKSFVDNKFDPRSVFVSIAEIGGEFNLPDAGGIVNPNTVGKMIEPWEGTVEISTDGMPYGGTDLSIVKSSDDYYAIKDLAKDRDEINKWSTYLRDQNGGVSPERLSFEVDKWISRIEAELSSNNFSDCFVYSNADRGSCIGFAKKSVNGKTEYMPIVMNMSVPKTVNSIVPMVDGDNVVVGMYSNLSWSDATDRKLMMDRVPDKEITRLPEGWLRDNWPTLSVSIDGRQVEVDAIYPSATEGSRVADMTVKQLLDNYWYAGRRFGYNTFYKKNELGRWDIAPALKTMSPSDFKDLMSGKTEQWRKVESGDLLLFDPREHPEACRVSKSIVSNCIMHGINPAEVFCSTVVNPGTSEPAVSRRTNVMYTMVLGHLDKPELNDLFSAMSDGKICPKSDEEYDGSSVFDKNGRVKVSVPVVEWNYEGRPNIVGSKEVMYTCHVGRKNSPGISTDLGAVSGSGSYSTQHVVKRGIENYVPNEFIDRMVDYISIKNGMYARFMDDPGKYAIPNDDMRKYVPVNRNKYEFVEAALDSPIDSYRERDRRAKIMMESDNYRKVVPVKLADGVTIVSPDSGTPQGERLAEAVASLRKDLGVDLTWKEVNILVREQTGWTVNGGSGLDFLYLDHVIEAIDAMRATLKNTNGKLLIEGGQSPFGDRISFPLLPKFMADRIWSSQKVREANGNDRSSWEQEMKDSMRTKTSVAIENMNMNKFSESRKKALKRHADYLYLDNGINPDDTMVYGDTSLKDIFESDNLLLDALFGKDKVVSEEWQKKNQEQLRKIEGIKKQAAGDGNVMVMATDTEAGFISRKKHKEIDVPRKVLRDMSALSKLNATLSLPLAVGNTADRLVNQTLMGTMLNLGSIGVGPYSGGIVLSKDTIKGVSHDENFRKIYEAHRLASFDASEIDFLAKVKTADDVDKFLNARFQSMGLFEKWQDRIQNLVSGGNIGLNGQIENMVTRFAQRAGVDGHDWWSTKVGNSTLLEQQLRTNPSKWFLDIISGKNAADHSLLMQSINWARRGDMAQKNIVSVVYGEMVKDRPVAEFLTSTMVCRFVQYTTNKTGRVLNWVAPVSSINYLATNFAANTELGKRLNLQDVQVNANFREALLVDAMHMTLPTIALFLAAMTGAIEPPEDEDKWGNYEEWTIFGQRVQAAWWIEDIIGPAIPLAAFYRSVQLGNPRIDIVAKAYSNMLWSNPMVKVGEFLAGFLESGFEEDEADGYNMDYADSRFGQPSSPERLVGDAAGVALSYAGQFVTPSWLKEIYNSMQEFEVSYKRIYEENEVGNLTEAGMAGETMKTSYFDSQIRKVTRNNPVLGALMDLVTDSNTGYMASEMPRTVMYDQDQIDSVQLYSMYEADGVTPKPVQQQQAIVLEVIGILQSTDDMEALYNSGFMLSYDTKKAVGDALYDAWHSLDVEYNRMAMNGEFDAYFYSDDFNEGLAMATQAREVLKAEKAYWQSMYYDKLWSEPMNRGLAKYNRRKTTYAQDDNGDWYATGTMQNPFGVLPVVLSPGKTVNEEGYMLNMGRGEDWATQSIVTGGSTGQRALVPIEPEKVEIPDFEGLGDSSNGGYSSSYPGSGYSNYGGRSGYRGYNYGGGYYSRSYGGGGGSSYTPDIYSRLPSVYSSSPKVMYADRLYDPSFDYMYPKFETKGSRESYKRQDI